ncbi:MAG TPA: UxaA family hydrolase [bacterium]|nr:UxaA family hydrolase [bacterium]
MHSFLVHRKGDHVGVAVEDVSRGGKISGVNMDDDTVTPTLVARDDVPLGHKVALRDIDEGADVIEYGVRIGLARTRILTGAHVHTHNLKSARW